MKKYFSIFKSEVMTSIQYVLDNLFGFIGFFIMIYIFLNLWKYMYSDPNELINGYSMNQTIWYVIITEIMWTIIGGRKFSKKIADDVRNGNIAYNINKPYNYTLYSLSSHLGEIFFRGIIYTILAMVLGYIFLGSFPELTIVQGLLIVLVSILALVISSLIIIFIGLFSFIIEDSGPFYWVYSKIILVLGTIFPIEFFPEVVQKILVFSPIYVTCYGPARLFVNFSYADFVSIIIAQGIHLIISFSLCLLLYRKGVKNLNVNGG